MFNVRIGKAYSFLLTAVLASGSVEGQAAEDAAKPPATPEEVIGQLANAATLEDYAGVLATFAKAPRESIQELDATTLSFVNARKALNAAMENKFGKDSNQPAGPGLDKTSMGKLRAAAYAEAQITKKNLSDRAELRVRVKPNLPSGKEHEIDMVAVKEGGCWKLIPPRFDARENKVLIKFVRAQETALKEVTKKVVEGAYNSREGAEFAMTEALRIAHQKVAEEAGVLPAEPSKKP